MRKLLLGIAASTMGTLLGVGLLMGLGGAIFHLIDRKLYERGEGE